MATISNNAQIRFRHGTQANLNDLMTTKKSQIESGTFYLTNDTHRLYIGLSDQTLAPVNEGIAKYTSAAFPAADVTNMGQFAYIEGTGILCVSNGQEWFQINPDTNTEYTFTEGTTTDTSKNTVKFAINAQGTIKKSGDSGIGSNVKSNEEISFTIAGKQGVIVEGNETTITVYGARLNGVVTDEKNFTLTMNDKNGVVDSSVPFTTNANMTIEKSGDAIALLVKDTVLDRTATNGGKSLETGFQIMATDTDKNQSGGSIDPVIKYGNTPKNVHFHNGTATLDVYTKEEVDNLQLQFNAMNYCGVTTDIPSGDVHNGDTYKASEQFEFTQDNKSVRVHVGDIIIARGTENANGIITSPTWDVVPSGNEDTQYAFADGVGGYGIDLMETPLGQNAKKTGSLHFTAGKTMVVTKAYDQSSNKVTIDYKHDNVACATPTGDAVKYVTDTTTWDKGRKSFNAVTGVVVNAQGHVESVTTTPVTLANTNATLESMATSATNVDGGAKVTLTTTLNRTGDTTGSGSIKSTDISYLSNNSNLTISGTGANVTLGFVWGTFGS